MKIWDFDSDIGNPMFLAMTQFCLLCFLHRALRYNYATSTKQIHSFLNQYLILDVPHTFRTSWVHPQEDRLYMQYGTFICIGVSSLVGWILCPSTLLTRQVSQMRVHIS
jgi:hypothetical protein